jgi:fructose/tagatose bisphosphate aldolase
MAAGRGELSKRFTVPAINVRALNYDMSRAIFRAANKLKVGALIFEIARSEMGYTDQRPAEYVSAIIGAAIKEAFRGPLFIQGDHFQVSAKGFLTDPQKEINAVKNLISESVEAGFYNIDIDTSTLVDLDQETLDGQQRNNYHLCAEFTRFVREVEPGGITVSLGGEIGEVGGHNSTVPELHAFMRGYQNETKDTVGISKISVQTGTSHGGIVLPDGTLAQVKVDFETLKELSDVSRAEFGLGGAVQHGASTLPPSAFNNFPESNAIEIHLATGFQNIIYELLPEETVNQAYQYLKSNLKNEWKEGQTEDQFLYSARKKAIGPFKEEWWNLEPNVLLSIGQALQEQFEFLFKKLEVSDTREITQKNTPAIKIHRPLPSAVDVQDDLEIAADLAD